MTDNPRAIAPFQFDGHIILTDQNTSNRTQTDLKIHHRLNPESGANRMLTPVKRFFDSFPLFPS